jgi:hypothetical protein
MPIQNASGELGGNTAHAIHKPDEVSLFAEDAALGRAPWKIGSEREFDEAPIGAGSQDFGLPTEVGDLAILTERTQSQVYPCLQNGPATGQLPF